MDDWSAITFLESAENAKSRLAVLTGRTPSTSIAREVGVCLRQGRLFFESADRSGLEIRPLLLFYGTLSFAKALVVGTSLQSTATLPKSHGIRDISSGSAGLADLALSIGSAGTFQRFNDTVAQLNRFRYLGGGTMTRSFLLPTASSASLEDLQFTIKDILSRVPGLQEIYRRTFGEPAGTEPISHINPSFEDETYWELRIDDRDLFSDREGLKRLIQKWRSRFPLLGKFRVVEATRAWDNSIIMFGNVAVPDGELDEEWLSALDWGFIASDTPQRNAAVPRIPIEELIGTDGASFAGERSIASPYQGIYASKYSLHYLGMFLLSSLVRYRPEAWVHAISRTATAEKPADDRALSLLEQFMKLHYSEILGLITSVFNS